MTSKTTRERLGVYKNIKNCRTESLTGMVEPAVFDAVGRHVFDINQSKSAWLRELILNELDRYDVKIERSGEEEYYQ